MRAIDRFDMTDRVVVVTGGSRSLGCIELHDRSIDRRERRTALTHPVTE
jgi:hypothetical protein